MYSITFVSDGLFELLFPESEEELLPPPAIASITITTKIQNHTVL